MLESPPWCSQAPNGRGPAQLPAAMGQGAARGSCCPTPYWGARPRDQHGHQCGAGLCSAATGPMGPPHLRNASSLAPRGTARPPQFPHPCTRVRGGKCFSQCCKLTSCTSISLTPELEYHLSFHSHQDSHSPLFIEQDF